MGQKFYGRAATTHAIAADHDIISHNIHYATNLPGNKPATIPRSNALKAPLSPDPVR